MSVKRPQVQAGHEQLTITRQCELLQLPRASYYYQPRLDRPEDLIYKRLIDQIFLDNPCWGSRKITAWLQRQGHSIGRQRVRRYMREMGIQAIYQRPKTSAAQPEHKKYPRAGVVFLDRL